MTHICDPIITAQSEPGNKRTLYTTHPKLDPIAGRIRGFIPFPRVFVRK